MHEVVVALVPRSRGQKDDQRDAVGLAQALRLGAIERQVYKHAKQFREMKELARVYCMVTSDVVRTKKRIKSVYRARGVSTPGKGVHRACQPTRFARGWQCPVLCPSLRLTVATSPATKGRPQRHLRGGMSPHPHVAANTLRPSPRTPGEMPEDVWHLDEKAAPSP